MYGIGRFIKNSTHQVLRSAGVDVVKRRDHPDPLRDIRRSLGGTGGVPIRTIFDIGAHVGETALAYQRAFPQATIHSFEPFPESHAQLCRNTEKHRSITVHQLALSDQEGTAQFHVNSFDQTNSLLPNDARASSIGPHEKMRPLTSIEVPVSTIDSFCTKHHLDTIDLLKIDTQGNELKVLQGASRMLTPSTIRLIYLEVLFAPLYEGQAQFHEILAFLHKRGYAFHDLYSQNRDEQNGLLWADALFRPE